MNGPNLTALCTEKWNTLISPQNEQIHTDAIHRKNLKILAKSVAYIALATIAVIATAFLAPGYILYTAAASLIGSHPFIERFIEPVLKDIETLEEKIRQIQFFRRSFEPFREAVEPNQIPAMISEIYAQYQQDRAESQLRVFEDAKIQARVWEQRHPEEKEKTRELQNQALLLHMEVRKEKIRSIFLSHLSHRRPQLFQRLFLAQDDLFKTLSSYAEIKLYLPDERQRGKFFDNPVQDQIVFTNRNFQPILLDTKLLRGLDEFNLNREARGFAERLIAPLRHRPRAEPVEEAV